ncbi:MAG: transcription antitermination factor NusB [Cytophagales bacterium]|nr:transcription antitermination factor NusB [Cytophagales bacterium]
MLNRRILRIKAMQALYSFYTTKASLIAVVRDGLEQTFTPTADVHDLSDTEEIDTYRKQALSLYDQNLLLKKVEASAGIADQVFDEVSKAIDSYYSQVKSEISRVKKQMLDGTHDLQDVYYKFLMLPGEFQHLELLDKEKKDASRISNNEVWRHHFITNPVINALNSFQPLQKQITSKKLSWQENSNHLKLWYKDIIKTEEVIANYQQIEFPTPQEHIDVLVHFYKKIIFKNEFMIEHWEQEDVRWSENGMIIKSMLTKTVQGYESELEEPFELKSISLNEEEDFEFFETIYDATIKEDEYLEGLISQRTKNWDVSRLAMTDGIILKMALVEMIYCRSIPVKVTINEYIEVCKQYSTPKSKQFVNGILDVLANQLTSESIIKKTGRGLIDNK